MKRVLRFLPRDYNPQHSKNSKITGHTSQYRGNSRSGKRGAGANALYRSEGRKNSSRR